MKKFTLLLLCMVMSLAASAASDWKAIGHNVDCDGSLWEENAVTNIQCEYIAAENKFVAKSFMGAEGYDLEIVFDGAGNVLTVNGEEGNADYYGALGFETGRDDYYCADIFPTYGSEFDITENGHITFAGYWYKKDYSYSWGYYKFVWEKVEDETPAPALGKYLTAQEIRDNADNLRIGILNVTTTGGKYINGEAASACISSDGTLESVTDPTAADILVLEKAGENQYYLKRESDGLYLTCSAGGNISLSQTAGATTATFGIYGPDEEGYGTISGFDDLFTDIDKSTNEYMVRFISQNQYLNGQSWSAVGGLRGGTGAWSFNYVRNADYTEGTEPEGVTFTLNSYSAAQGADYESWGQAFTTVDVTLDVTITGDEELTVYFPDSFGGLYTEDWSNSAVLQNGKNVIRFIDIQQFIETGENTITAPMVVGYVDAEGNYSEIYVNEGLTFTFNAEVSSSSTSELKAEYVDPEEGEVESLSVITLTYPCSVEFTNNSYMTDNAAVLYNENGEVEATAYAEYDAYWEDIVFVLDHEVTVAGKYSLVLTPGVFYDTETLSIENTAEEFTWTVVGSQEPWEGTPTVSVASAESIEAVVESVTVEFEGGNVGYGDLSILAGVFDESGDCVGLAYLGKDFNQCGAVEFKGSKATVKFVAPIEAKAEVVDNLKKKIGGYQTSGEAMVYFCGGSFSVNGYNYNEPIAETFELTAGKTTGINAIALDSNASIYDLTGRRVNNAAKTQIYLQNGKKVIK